MRPLKVSEVNNYIKRLFNNDLLLPNVTIEGEISNFTHHYSGHMYFSLKDDGGKIKSVMFKSDNAKLLMELENGMSIVATGYISVYEREGGYQFYIRHIKEGKEGNLYRDFELLKAKLNEEGLFDEKYKKEMPKLPKKIGIVTSATGAAIQDIITVAKRRYPSINLLVYPAAVQGKNSAEEIIKGLKTLDKRDDVDIIIFGRGGGSMEELFSFNDEELARTIFNLKTPCISAVGHEIDFTISDFVADLRAATPSAAAEIAVPNINSLLTVNREKMMRLRENITRKLDKLKFQNQKIHRNLEFLNPISTINNKKLDLDLLYRELTRILEKKINTEEKRLLNIEKKLIGLNPSNGLAKGQGFILNALGESVDSIEKLNLKDKIKVILKDGSLEATVTFIEED